MLVGLVGRPNSGKSTFFKAATLADVLIAPYPFATIKPNQGVAYVKIRDLAADFGKVSNPREGYVKKSIRFVPFDLMDVAGLVEGASQGKGLGNEFLSDLAGANAFIHVVDMSGETNGEGKPAENYYPGNDIKIIEKELDLWYLGILSKVWKTFARTVEMQKQKLADAIAKQFSGLKVDPEDVKEVILKSKLNSEKPSSWSDSDLYMFAQTLRKVTKPMIIAANKSDLQPSESNIRRLKEKFQHLAIIPCSGDAELALREAAKKDVIDYIPGDPEFKIKGNPTEQQKKALLFIQENVLKKFGSTGVQQVLNTAVLDLLQYIAIFPGGINKLTDQYGNILPDCFLLPRNSTALDFANKIHTDLGKNFVKAIDVKTKQAVGKEHKLKHRDGLEIVTR